MTTLDKSRPYGTITPHHFDAVFEQDGRFFDGAGEFMPDHPDNLKLKGKLIRRKPDGPPPAKPEEDTGEVNLTEWAKGSEKFPWFKVVKAIRDRYNVQVTTKHDAIDLLIKEGVIESDEAAA